MTSTLPRRARALVCVLALLGSAPVAIASGAQKASASPAVYNGKIVYVGAGGVTFVNPDGTDASVITTGGYPTWSPNGDRIGLWQAGNYVSVAKDGTDLQTVAEAVTSQSFPTWSPDGTRVAYMSDADFGISVFVHTVGEPTDVDLLPGGGADLFPAWSPDGSKIAYQSNTSGQPVIWIVNADGTDAHAVPNMPPGNSGTPSFSRDGTKVVFENNPAGDDTIGEVFVIGVDGTGLTQVGPTDRYNMFPSFSPDGTKIVYSSSGPGYTHDSATGIYVMNVDGSNARQITHGSGLWAKWQPLPTEPANLAPRSIGTAKEKFPLWVFGNAEASFDGDGTIVSYEWRWGDNTPVTHLRYAWHHYSQPGTYLVRLTVIDNDGAKSTRKAWFRVS